MNFTINPDFKFVYEFLSEIQPNVTKGKFS